jgi:LysR family cys regulon transcriptional activator
MNLRQLQYLHEIARQNLSVSRAAKALFTSQPGISKQIRLLEEELGVTIFTRAGKRLVGVTEPGTRVLTMVAHVLGEVGNIRQVSDEYSGAEGGDLTIATTHTQARYALPGVIKNFLARYPRVRVRLHQGNPTQIAEMALSGEADIAIATEAIAEYNELVMLPCYEWNRSVIVPPRHALLKERRLTLAKIARYPLVTYDFAFAGRSEMNRAFAAAGLAPDVVLTAIDADVIKTYVELGLGIGIIATMAYDPKRDRRVRAIDARHLFEPSSTKIGIRRGLFLRGYIYDFIELFAPKLTRVAVDAAMSAA